jgi:predicted small metal-binding protein
MTVEAKNLDTPDEKHSFEHGEVRVVALTGATVARAVLNPGWRWSYDVKPLVGSESCQAPHTAYVVSGRLHVRMDDGAEVEFGPGDAHYVSPGHDAWVVGDEPCVTIDFAAEGDTASAAGKGDSAVRIARCPCGVEFRASNDNVDELIIAIQEHARGSHGHEATREHVLAGMTSA